MTNSILDPTTTFPALCDRVGIDVRLRKAVARLGHVRPTLVQSKVLPLALGEGRDVLVRAQTGSGKTLAYCLPLLQKLLARRNNKGGVGAIVLVPTRELCTQVHETLRSLMYYCDDVLSSAVLSSTTSSAAASGGGSSNQQQQQAAERERQEALLRDEPDVVVATPAGLLSHLQQNGSGGGSVLANLKETVETLVVDEADLVLSFGYADDVAQIVRNHLPRICQGYLMSATLSPEVDSLKKIVLNSPVVLKLEREESDAHNNLGGGEGQLKQFYVAAPKRDKNLVLYVFLKLGLLKGKGLFFVNTTDAGYRLKLFLEQFHIRSAVLNAELPFRSRLNIIEQFNVGNFDYLIATDTSTEVVVNNSKKDKDDDDEEDEEVDAKEKDASNKQTPRKRKSDSEYGVSRGLDFRNVSFVVNVDFPLSHKSYLHRIGRTARGGAKGVALSLVDAGSVAENETLAAVQRDQPPGPLFSSASAATDNLQAAPAGTDTTPHAEDQQAQQQPMLLDFDLREVEGFRYRVEDVQRAVTRMAVREARAAELRAEILNSERLQSNFLADNPADLQLLRHDRVATHSSRVQEHLRHVPKYLLPRGMQVANLNKRKRRNKKRKRGTGDGAGGFARRSDNDPLQAFDGDVNLDGVQDNKDDGGADQQQRGDEDDDAFAEFMDDGEEEDDPEKKKDSLGKVYTGTKDGTGQSTAGRTAWKEKHRKGKFSGKKRMSERKGSQPLGI